MKRRRVTPCTQREHAFYASVPNMFADTYKGERKRMAKYFSASTTMSAYRAAKSWVRSHLVEIYGEARADLLENNHTAATKFKWGCGVNINIAEYRDKKTKSSMVRRIRVIWQEYELGKPVQRKRQWTITKKTPEEIDVMLHQANHSAARIRAKVSLSVIDDSAFEFDFDISAMPKQAFVYDKHWAEKKK